MGRPSLAPIRQAELLDAVQSVILERGVEATTVARVAEVAGIRPSHVHHYLGSRQQMLEAAVERALSNVERLVVDALESTPSEQRLAAQLDIIFSQQVAAPEVNQLIDQLVAASYFDPAIRSAVSAMYARFSEVLKESLAATYPGASGELRAEVAHGILALAHASAAFGWLNFESSNLAHARACAEQLTLRLT